MIRIIYNPNKLELVFSIASILTEFSEHKYLIAPAEVKNIFEKSPQILPYEKLELQDYEILDEPEEIEIDTSIPEKEEIILLGIRPENKEENIILINFFEKYSKQIKLWIDDGDWDKSVLNYFESDTDNIFVKKDSTCLQILTALGYPSSNKWLKTEYAMANIDLKNQLAARYIKATTVNKSIGLNYSAIDDYDFYLFMLIVKEIITSVEESYITQLEESFTDMMVKTQKAKNEIKDTHPVFKKAKARGRPVGYLKFGEIDHYLDIESILNYGSDKFPWLCIIKFKLEGVEQIVAKSKKIPINDILRLYDKDGTIYTDNILNIISSEILKHKK